jgi:hypothetical protein
MGEVNDKIPIKPDIEACVRLEKAGLLLIVAARNDVGRMIGYCTFILSNDIMSKDILCGTQGPFFVTKSKRLGGLGVRLYDYMIEKMKERGIKNIYPHHYLHGDSVKLSRYFVKLGAVKTQLMYTLWIGN